MSEQKNGRLPSTPSLKPLPELLAPAGSPDALEAAIGAGADAVYLGGSAFNARMNAHNFDRPSLEAAVKTAHAVGTRVYLTLNTLVYDRERAAALEAAYEAALCGVDGLIIADIGMASLIHRALPHLPLHASTQLSGHNHRVGEFLKPRGFSRYVTARESSLQDIRDGVERSGLEVEVFIHGALCVSHSGQCLFSSVVGGRSGNRGECAQPCRLPYAGCGGCASSPSADRQGRRDDRQGRRDDRLRDRRDGEYPLSLKDLSLARHLPALIDAGVASLKIEGRMKSPAYVGGVTAIWRRLLDERRGATDEEMAALSDLFSRGGFTDGYATGRITHAMMGVRSDEDKLRTQQAEKTSPVNTSKIGRLPVDMAVTVEGNAPVTLRATAPLYRQDSGHGNTVTVTVAGDIPVAAQNPAASLTADALQKQLSRTGGTAYAVRSLEATVADGLLLPVSRLNALRRAAIEALDMARAAAMTDPSEGYDPTVGYNPTVKEEMCARPTPIGEAADIPPRHTARFRRPDQITKAAQDFFDILYLSLAHWQAGEKRGVILPPVVFDREAAAVVSRLAAVIADGARHILVGNVGHLPLVREAATSAGVAMEALTFHGDFRLNVTNTTAAAVWLGVGTDTSAAPDGGCADARSSDLRLADVILSPELTLPRMRDISDALPGRIAAVVYGRLPLMLLEKCVIRELYGTKDDVKAPNGQAGEACRLCVRDAAAMIDRKGVRFPVLRVADHRNVVLNSLPLSMTDRQGDLARAHLTDRHMIFTVESADEVDAVIRTTQQGRPLDGDVRRMLNK